MAADVHLEHVGAPLRELVDAVRRVRRRRLDRVLVDHPVAAAAERQREQRHDRRAGAQRQRRDGRRRRGRPIEEVHVDRVAALDVLIDQDADALARPAAAASRAGSCPAGRSRVLPVRVRMRSSRSFSARLSSARASTAIGGSRSACTIACSSQKPKWPVTNSTPLPCAYASADALLALELDARQHRLGRQRAELQQLEQQPAEVLERAADDAPPLGRRIATGKAAATFSLGDPAVRADRTRRRPGRAARRSRSTSANGMHAHDRDERPHRQVLEAMLHRAGAMRRERAREGVIEEPVSKASAGSMVTVSGTDRDRQARQRRSASSRTASFSVVSTIAAPAPRRAARRCASMSAGVKRW